MAEQAQAVDQVMSPRRPRKEKSNGNNTGSIYQNADGQWLGWVSLGYGVNGKRARKCIRGKTRTEVQAGITKLLHEKNQNLISKPNKITVGEFLTQWLASIPEGKLAESTRVNYQRAVRQLVPRFGKLRLQALEPTHIEKVFTSMEQDGVKPHGRLRAHCVLHLAMKKAVKFKLIQFNPVTAVDPPYVEPADVDFLDEEQAGRLLEVIKDHRLKALFIVAIGAGLRWGELVALKWSDIDLDSGTLQVNRSMSEIGGHLKEKVPKSRKSKRTIDLPTMVITALGDHLKAMLKEGLAGAGYVFVNTIGTPLRRTNFHLVWDPIKEKAGIPKDFHFHGLRHSFAALQGKAGVDLQSISERMGHANSGITSKVYMHATRTMKKEAATKLDSVLEAALAGAVQKSQAAIVAIARTGA